ncbi:MAG: flagellar biosynthetic protein FliR [Acidobacteriaceae bacterium]
MTSTGINAVISGMLTIAVRLSGLMLFAPFFGSPAMPPRIKAGVVIALTFFLLPTVGRGIGPYASIDWPLLVLREFLIGAGMGIATHLVFDAVDMAGQILGMQMGYSLVNLLDPQTQVDTTVMAVFHQSIVMLLFLMMNVQYWLLAAIGDSFLYLPPRVAGISGIFSLEIVKTVGLVFGLGVRIAAPVLAATLVTDMLLGLLGKASAQLPLMLLGPAIKSLLGVAILITTLRYWPNLFQRLFEGSLENGVRILHLAG